MLVPGAAWFIEPAQEISYYLELIVPAPANLLLRPFSSIFAEGGSHGFVADAAEGRP